jgi:hypothetical protein
MSNSDTQFNTRRLWSEAELQVLFRDMQARIMSPAGFGEAVVEKPKPVTSESRFVEILTAATLMNFTQLVDSCETQGLTDDLVNSDVTLGYEEHKKLCHVFTATADRRDSSRYGMVPSRSLHVIGVAIKEFALDVELAKAGKLAEEAQAAKPLPETQNGMTRREVFQEEAERRATYQDNSLPPLERNRWAYRQ